MREWVTALTNGSCRVKIANAIAAGHRRDFGFKLAFLLNPIYVKTYLKIQAHMPEKHF